MSPLGVVLVSPNLMGSVVFPVVAVVVFVVKRLRLDCGQSKYRTNDFGHERAERIILIGAQLLADLAESLQNASGSVVAVTGGRQIGQNVLLFIQNTREA